MGNARNGARRLGVIRPGPQSREAAAKLAEAERRVRAEGARIRQARRRERLAELAETGRALAQPREGQELVELSERDVSRISNKCVALLSDVLKDCPNPDSVRLVIEKVLNHNNIWPVLPHYYPRPCEARAIYSFLESYRTELRTVKSAHSNHFLARKGALLDAAVSEGIDGHRALSRVLNVHPRNISTAKDRRDRLDSVFHPGLLTRSKRSGLSEYAKDKVQAWWHEHTRVSPNKKDVTRKRVGKKQYDVHATHYLTDTQDTWNFVFFVYLCRSSTCWCVFPSRL